MKPPYCEHGFPSSDEGYQHHLENIQQRSDVESAMYKVFENLINEVLDDRAELDEKCLALETENSVLRAKIARLQDQISAVKKTVRSQVILDRGSLLYALGKALE